MTRRLAAVVAVLLSALSNPANAARPATETPASLASASPTQASRATTSGDTACGPCIRAHLEFLASDALRGRGSATGDEWTAATYLATQMRLVGLEPMAADGSFLQRIDLVEQPLLDAPSLSLAGTPPTRLRHGAEILAVQVTGSAAGPLRKVAPADVATRVQTGDIALLQPAEDAAMGQIFQAVGAAKARGAVAVLVPQVGDAFRAMWQRPARIDLWRKGAERPKANIVVLNAAAAMALAQQADGTRVTLDVPLGEERTRPTWNVVGRVRGERPDEFVLLSAHLDHLGDCPPVNGDAVCNGADDDASGTAAVMELARTLAQSGRRPRRTVVFTLFGSEEMGGHGSTGFRESGLVPLTQVVANLQFEMIGRKDAAVRDDELWLTGFERSDLGPALVRHGARLVADPHPEQNFFQRSDNYGFARAGVVAHTVSSYGLHSDYHEPSDELKTIDFDHMTRAIQSLFAPVRWLVNSDWKPAWAPGRKP